MAVQEVIALGIVALTGLLLGWRLMRRRRRGGALPCCGCPAAGQTDTPPPVRLRARREGPG